MRNSLYGWFARWFCWGKVRHVRQVILTSSSFRFRQFCMSLGSYQHSIASLRSNYSPPNLWTGSEIFLGYSWCNLVTVQLLPVTFGFRHLSKYETSCQGLPAPVPSFPVLMHVAADFFQLMCFFLFHPPRHLTENLTRGLNISVIITQSSNGVRWTRICIICNK